jgi:hypothetical protein
MNVEDIKDINQIEEVSDEQYQMFIDFKDGSKLEFRANENPMIGFDISDELMRDPDGNFMENPYEHQDIRDVIDEWYEAN